MKKTIFILATLLGLGDMFGAAAQDVKDITPGVSISHFKMDRNGKYLTVEMSMDLTELDVDANRAVLLTPRLINGTDSLDLPSIGIYGHRRYYYYIRNGINTISGESETAFRTSRKPDNIDYNNAIIYEKWMNGATLKFHRCDWGCCHEILAKYEGILGRHSEGFFPELVFVRPEAEAMKSRSLSGSAFIDFPVNKTVIYPEYRRNTMELGKIQATIDSVRSDKDVTIVSVWLKGYASPESPYPHNKNLAIGRTKSLKEHIRKLYHFPDDIILTEHEPEDWEGLRRYVESSNINHRAEILEMIDSDMDPDAKEAKIKRAYPEEYRFLLQHCYPALRHTDYRIDYRIRSYSNVGEIKRVMAEQPQKLSLNEFYLLARTYEPGTAEFTEVFETAVRMFPHDEIANLNAANTAMSLGDLSRAAGYLDKAGSTAEAVYARGVYAALSEDWDSAGKLFSEALGSGIAEAAAALEQVKKLK